MNVLKQYKATANDKRPKVKSIAIEAEALDRLNAWILGQDPQPVRCRLLTKIINEWLISQEHTNA